MFLPRDVATSQNVSPVISICSIILLIIAIVSVVGRIWTKIKVVSGLSFDDYTILGAAVCCAGQTAAVLSAAANGLGKEWSVLGLSQQDIVEKAIYASGLLFIAAILLTKLSVVLFIGTLAPIAALLRTGYALGAIFLLWGLASLLAAAFQCHPPSTWHLTDTATCYDIRAFWVAFDSINIVTDAALVAWPVIVVSRLHASKRRRTIFIACFASRLLVIGATVAQLTFTVRNTAAYAAAPSFDIWPVILAEQVVQCASITSACIPQLRPFITTLESGYITTRLNQLQRQSTKDEQAHSNSDSSGSKSTARTKRSKATSATDSTAIMTELPVKL